MTRNETFRGNAFAVCVLAAVCLLAAALDAQAGGFVENRGQWDQRARFRAGIAGAASGIGAPLEMWLTETGYVYAIRQPADSVEASAAETGVAPVPVAPTGEPVRGEAHAHVVAVGWVGAGRATVEGLDPLPGVYNWLAGDGSRSVRGVRAYRTVVYRGLYPGVDAQFDVLADSGTVETTYVVAPGADPGRIQLSYDGAESLRVDAAGNLVLVTSLGTVLEQRPVAFQPLAGGGREAVRIGYTLDGNHIRFKVADVDPGRPLVIDPVVQFSRTVGGTSSDYVAEMHEDASGRYVTGFSSSSDLPTTTGAYQEASGGGNDLFAAKFSVDNTTLLWMTYIGGTSDDYGGNSALTASGTLYLAGSANAGSNFGATYSYGTIGGYDVVVAHLAADGASLLSSAVIGGTSTDYGSDVVFDGSSVFVTGATTTPTSTSFPAGEGPAGHSFTQTGNYDAFVARLSGDLDHLYTVTLVPGSTNFDGGNSLAFDGSGNVYLHGITLAGTDSFSTLLGPGGNYDLFVTKYNPTLTTMAYNTRIGGGSTEPMPGWSYTSGTFYSIGMSAIVVDSINRAWVTGASASTDFPTTPGVVQPANAGNYDVFVLRLSDDGQGIDYGTFVGGGSTDVGRAIVLDTPAVYVAGSAYSENYPTTAAAVQPSNGGSYDYVLTVLRPNLGRYNFSSYWGGSSTDYGSDLVVGPDGAVRVAGSTVGSFPVVPGGSSTFGAGGGYDGGVVAIDGSQVDLVMSKTVTTEPPYEWRIAVANLAIASAAVFPDGSVILLDNLPAADYGPVVVENVIGLSNEENIVCGIVANDLTCRAVGADVAIHGGGSFDVVVPFTVGASTTLTNPRAGGIVAVDPDNVVPDEEDEGNNGAPPVQVEANAVTIPTLGGVGLAALAALVALLGAWLAFRRAGLLQ